MVLRCKKKISTFVYEEKKGHNKSTNWDSLDSESGKLMFKFPLKEVPFSHILPPVLNIGPN